jgi:hypothetical protein
MVMLSQADRRPPPADSNPNGPMPTTFKLPWVKLSDDQQRKFRILPRDRISKDVLEYLPHRERICFKNTCRNVNHRLWLIKHHQPKEPSC